MDMRYGRVKGDLDLTC